MGIVGKSIKNFLLREIYLFDITTASALIACVRRSFHLFNSIKSEMEIERFYFKPEYIFFFFDLFLHKLS